MVNIITKKPGDKFAGSATVYTNRPEHSEEGDTRRASFNLSGPVAENFSFRLYGNVAKTDADDTSLNSHVSGLKLPPAGREGVRNRDLNALLRWDLTPQQVLELETGVSRQGNIYTGERLMDSNTNANNMLALLGQETNITHRNTVGLTHRGQWDWGTSRLLFQTENTRRTQYPVGLAGGAEGSITSTAASNMVTSRLHNYFLNGEVNTPFNLGGQRHMLTSGFEYRNEKLDDPGANRQSSISSSGDDISRLTGSGGQRTGKADAQTWAIYVEDNFEPLKSLIVTPGLRFDHHSQSGNNWSPSLNTTYHLSEQWSVKGGVARAFKAPNLYQTNSNYLYYTRGNGCPLNSPSIGGGCYIRGNPDLHAETSVNKELGLAFNGGEGLDASLSYFQNDYRNKIYAEMNDNAPTVIGRTKVFQWMNASRAVVRGVEGNLTLPLLGKRGDTLKWINNFTYMIKNHNKATQQPLSVIPEYTVNSTLDWRVTPQWSTQLYATFYGRQKPRTIGSGGYAATGNALTELGSYATFGLGAQYQVRRELSLNFGVNNIADKRLFRNASNSAGGAATYNEPGRTYYVSLTGRF
ncbi:FepA family TonB-dependent siderophore receptor [Diaphorobacter aerolatus]|uniref:FepA family TonB-dependent siderophore receptor n=1 Tax=Diaphorobacter aerolatus TaxID=1288495 RepID=UPI0021F783C2|nr:FepA family TonB-dependent siderophore receptor [Diaphorobacter aerolatus]